MTGHIARIVLLLWRQRGLAIETLRGVRHLQRRIDTHALIEDETIAMIMRAATLFEIFQDAAIELQHIAEALGLHIGASLLAANAARAEHDDGLVLHLLGELGNGGGEVTKMIHARRQRIVKRAELHLIVVARIEQRDLAPLIEPRLQLRGRDLWRGALRRVDARHTKGDDLALDAHQHPAEGLISRVAIFGSQRLKTWNRTQPHQELLDRGLITRDEEIDPFRAQQDRAAQLPRLAKGQ